MSLTNPNAIWALAGLAVPLLIHLLSHDRGRRLPFAAVRFIPGFRSQRMRSPSLSEWLLFLLRCLLLIALGLLLAQPILRAQSDLDGPVVVLVSPLALAAGGPGALKLAAEIAAQNNTTARILAPRFPKPGTIDVDAVPGGAWSLLAELEGQISEQSAILLLMADDPRETGVSKPVFDHRVEFSVISGPAALLPVAPLRIGLMTSEQRSADLVYLVAALDVLQASGLALTHESLPFEDSAADYDLLIVLSADDCPEPSAGQLLLCDGDQFVLSSRGTTRTVMDYAGQPFDLRLAEDDKAAGSVLLTTRDRQTVASLHRLGAGTLLRWHSRFNPGYASVVASLQFPDLLGDLIRQSHQIRPQNAVQRAHPTGPGLLRWVIEVLVLLLWITERWLSGRAHAKRPL